MQELPQQVIDWEGGFEIKKLVFWAGVGFLIGGVVLSAYGFVAVRSVFDELRELFMPPFRAYSVFSSPPALVLQAQLFLMQFLQLAGFVMAVLGAVMLAYSLWVKKEVTS